MKKFVFPAVFLLVSLPVARSAAADDKPAQDLRSRAKVGDLVEVTVTMEVGGDLRLAAEKDKAEPLKMSGVVELRYQEKLLAVPTTSAGAVRSARDYTLTKATVKVGEKSYQPELRAERRLLGVALGDRFLLYSPGGPLTREELDLVEIPANSLLVEQLLPDKKVAQGDTWKHSDGLMRALLGMDSITANDVSSVFYSTAENLARMQLSGRVEGKISGADTVVEIKGKYQFDLRLGRVTWAGLLIHEVGQPGEVLAGTDYVARFQMFVNPLEKSEHLTAAALKAFGREPGEENLSVLHLAADGAWQIAHSRDWFVTADQRDLTVFKLLVKGERMAQCNVSSLAPAEGGRQPALADFQADVKQALSTAFGEFVEASESTHPAGYRQYRVVVRSTVAELPVEWHYYFLSDQAGHRAVLAFTIQGEMVSKLDNADRALVNTLRFADKGPKELRDKAAEGQKDKGAKELRDKGTEGKRGKGTKG